MHMKRIIACCLVLLALLSLAACKPAADPTGGTTTEAPVSSTEADTSLDTELTGEQPPETSAPEDTEVETGTEIATESVSETGSLTASASETGTAVETTTSAPKFPINGTKAEIVKYYNTVANNTKAQKDFSARKDEKLDCAITEGLFSVLDSFLDSTLRRDDKNITETFRNGKGTKDTSYTPMKFLPPSNQSFMSKLDPTWIKSATCKAKGNGCEIVIVLNDETFLAKTEAPVRHDSCMDTLDVNWGDLPIEVEDTTVGTISGATITAIVNANGELLNELHIYEPMEVRGRGKLGIWMKLVVAGYWKQDIWFTW